MKRCSAAGFAQREIFVALRDGHEDPVSALPQRDGVASGSGDATGSLLPRLHEPSVVPDLSRFRA